jgi:hypothetical protein
MSPARQEVNEFAPFGAFFISQLPSHLSIKKRLIWANPHGTRLDEEWKRETRHTGHWQ